LLVFIPLDVKKKEEIFTICRFCCHNATFVLQVKCKIRARAGVRHSVVTLKAGVRSEKYLTKTKITDV